ncbi:hypothetical protein [Streptomyces sp. NPDC048256]|uniref:hypothetical protein n=1 Tax=unclassified Streptomyces TaxID=2593676 RepID=UPI0033C96C21
MTDMSGRCILHLRFVLPADPDPELPERLRRLLEDFTPRVQLIEPDMAVLDRTGALLYWKRDARSVSELVQCVLAPCQWRVLLSVAAGDARPNCSVMSVCPYWPLSSTRATAAASSPYR